MSAFEEWLTNRQMVTYPNNYSKSEQDAMKTAWNAAIEHAARVAEDQGCSCNNGCCSCNCDLMQEQIAAAIRGEKE